jgi:hypothetical protein
VLIAGMLMCATSLGAARTAQADPTNDPRSLALLASSGETLRVRGMVATEPDLRQGYRLLTLDCDAVSRDGGHTWQVAGGRVEAAWYGPDDWFAPAYGDTLELTGIIAPASASAPVGVVAQLTKAHGVIDARGGGNPVFAWLFQLRVMLAQAIQHALPEPEAALLIGILLGLKTPTLRARLPLFTATGTIHLVVPAGLKVSVLATIASTALRPLGRWPRVAGSIATVVLYAALGGSGPPAVRAAIMGTLLVLAPALGRVYNVFTALALASVQSDKSGDDGRRVADTDVRACHSLIWRPSSGLIWPLPNRAGSSPSISTAPWLVSQGASLIYGFKLHMLKLGDMYHSIVCARRLQCSILYTVGRGTFNGTETHPLVPYAIAQSADLPYALTQR